MVKDRDTLGRAGAILLVLACSILSAKSPNPLDIFSSKEKQSITIEPKEKTVNKPEKKQPKKDPFEIFHNTTKKTKKTEKTKKAEGAKESNLSTIGVPKDVPFVSDINGSSRQEQLDTPDVDDESIRNALGPTNKSEDTLKELDEEADTLFFSEGGEINTIEENNITVISETNNSKYQVPKVVVSGAKIIYLTFDDGPIVGTRNVINLLHEKEIKATMFFVGRQVDSSKKLFKTTSIMKNLFIGNHTYTHADGHYKLFYSKLETVINDIGKAQDTIGGAKYLRLCGRNVWRLKSISRDDRALPKGQVLQEAPIYDRLSQDGYSIFGWDTEWRFDHSTHLPLYTADELARRVATAYSRHTVKKGKIVLLAHDYMFRDKNSTKELGDFIDIMKNDGWTFESIDTY